MTLETPPVYQRFQIETAKLLSQIPTNPFLVSNESPKAEVKKSIR